MIYVTVGQLLIQDQWTMDNGRLVRKVDRRWPIVPIHLLVIPVTSLIVFLDARRSKSLKSGKWHRFRGRTRGNDFFGAS